MPTGAELGARLRAAAQTVAFWTLLAPMALGVAGVMCVWFWWVERRDAR